MADLERPAPITQWSVFDIGSTSKQFTAACVLLLAREGTLGLDDDVRRHVPELPELGGPITVRQLVHHTSGIRDYLNLTLLAGRSLDNDWQEDEVLGLLARQRGLDFEPGTKHSYSNSGYFLLGEIVRRVSGRTLRQFAAERIFEPLGMTRTLFRDDYPELLPGRALAYTPAGDGYRLDVGLWDVVGDGAVFTNVEDLARWDAQFYECTLPGGDGFIAELTTPGHLKDGTALDYAFGLTVGTYRGARVIQHGGSWGGYRAQLLRFPDLQTSIAVLANVATFDASGVAHQVADVLLEDRLDPAAAPEIPASDGAPESLTELAGIYADAERTLILEVLADGVRVQGNKFDVVRADGGGYQFKGLPVAFAATGPGTVRLEIGGEERFELSRLKDGAGPDLSGRYRCDELDVVYEIAGGRLRRGYQPWEDLAATGEGVAGFSHGVISVARDGFVVNTGRARGLRFERL